MEMHDQGVHDFALERGSIPISYACPVPPPFKPYPLTHDGHGMLSLRSGDSGSGSDGSGGFCSGHSAVF